MKNLLTAISSLSSSHQVNMPVTELVFPSYKLDPQSLAELKAKENQIFQSFSGVTGLEKACRGIILEEDGASVDAARMRNVLVLGKLSSLSPNVIECVAQHGCDQSGINRLLSTTSFPSLPNLKNSSKQ
jgi:hypothetical protein